MKTSIFTPKDFLRICEIINQLPDGAKVSVWLDGISVYFDSLFNSKKEAKEKIYQAVGTEIYGISIEAV